MKLKDFLKESVPDVRTAERGGLVVNGESGLMWWTVFNGKKFLMIAAKHGDRERISLPSSVVFASDVAEWVKNNWEKVEKFIK
jgi:hypothetical protein